MLGTKITVVIYAEQCMSMLKDSPQQQMWVSTSYIIVLNETSQTISFRIIKCYHFSTLKNVSSLISVDCSMVSFSTEAQREVRNLIFSLPQKLQRKLIQLYFSSKLGFFFPIKCPKEFPISHRYIIPHSYTISDCTKLIFFSIINALVN